MNAIADPNLIQMSLFDFIDAPESSPEDIESQHIETVLLRGSNFSRSKNRIQDYGITNPSLSDFANMLKNEYGTGGSSHVGKDIRNEMHDHTGIRFKWRSAEGEQVETKITWSNAAAVILKLIKEGRYKRDC